jgi:hypothetical protein
MFFRNSKQFFLGIAILLLASAAFAQLESAEIEDSIISEAVVRSTSITIITWAIILLTILIVISIVRKEMTETFKRNIFVAIVLVVMLPTIYFAVTTVWLNITSETGGPVHWHADFGIYVCGDEIPPPIPKGLSNKTGTPVIHEHEDRRLHVEGVLARIRDASLSEFFRVQGGELSGNSFTIPTGDSFVTIENGDTCSNGRVGSWQAFVYKVDDIESEALTARQSKLTDYTDYILSPHVLVPPGDCIIFEFGPEKTRTDKICDFYQIEANKGGLKIL